MNHLQLLAFVVYGSSVLIVGGSIYQFINKSGESFLNRSVYLGEAFLLGSILVAGELLVLSLVGLYKAPYLWGCVGLNYLFLLRRETREDMVRKFSIRKVFSFPVLIFLALLSVFIFRNYYFLVTGDSHNVYLFAQKLWLMKGTSILGDAGFNIAIFTPHFNAVPYSLGLSLFGQEVLFPQLINMSWHIVALLLVFGYTSYRLNGYYGLMAAILVLFDEHFFYSGINACVIINGAIIAFLFASVYNFWESRSKNCSFRFLLALIFLSQLMGNKYQMVYVTVLMAMTGLLIQPSVLQTLKRLFVDKRSAGVLATAVCITGLWYVKNFLATGCPAYPILADKFGVFNWTPEMIHNFSKVFGGVSIGKFLKYLIYFYVWPGVMPAKLLALIMIALPFVLLVAAFRNRIENSSVQELGFWLGVSLLGMAGVCFVCYTDPRIYRYLIAVWAFASIFAIEYVLRNCFGFKKTFVLGIGSMILFLLFLGAGIVSKKVIPCKIPTMRENADVLLNRIHMDDVILKYYPKNIAALKGFHENREKAMRAAWDIGRGGANSLSAFLLPVRPQVGLWCTSNIRWNSYGNKDSIINDLKEYGVEWIMNGEGDTLKFLTLAEFAEKAMRQERYPSQVFYNYSFPAELADIQW